MSMAGLGNESVAGVELDERSQGGIRFDDTEDVARRLLSVDM